MTRIADDPRSSGIPDRPSTDDTFLGVPIRSPDAVFSSLYLTDRVDGGSFTAEDEELVLALTVTERIAVENAQLYDGVPATPGVAEASSEISRQLLDSEAEHSETLGRIATSVKRLA